jgi:uncharacterized protein (DUF2126 family)
LMPEEKQAPSNAQMKFLVHALWRCFQAPAWTKDSLITLGKVVFAKTSLKDMNEKAFGEIWPHLKVMAETLDTTLTEEATRLVEEQTKNAEVEAADEAKTTNEANQTNETKKDLDK